MQAQAPLTPHQVYAAISGATEVNARIRSESETLLRSWERDAAPGFLDSLLQIASQTGFVDEVRFLSYFGNHCEWWVIKYTNKY